jgi:hypothetical protein
MENQSFYMVFVEGGRMPAFKHSSLEAAEKEAKRLAESVSKKAWVMATIKSFETVKWDVKDCRPFGEDLPF